MTADSFVRREKLLDAAMSEFSAKSYDETSLNTILKNAGISKGSFYYHFPDKQALYFNLLDRSVKQKWAYIREKAAGCAEEFSSADLFDQFRMQASFGASFAFDNPEYYRLGLRFAAEKGKPVYEEALSYLGTDSPDMLSVMIDDAIGRQYFRPEFTRDFLQQTLRFLMTRFDEIIDSEANISLESTLQSLDMFLDMLKNGVCRP